MNHEKYLVIDFEATCCDRGTIPAEQREIIEIGAVMVDAAGFGVSDTFQSFVRPVRYPELTEFCTALTSIRQADVDLAPRFPEAIQAFNKWLSQYYGFVFCSWGDFDLEQLRQDCELHKVPYPIGAPHLNAKRLIAARQRLPKKPGLGQAVRLAGLDFAGTPHRGLDDARNIARLLPCVFGDARLPAGASGNR